MSRKTIMNMKVKKQQRLRQLKIFSMILDIIMDIFSFAVKPFALPTTLLFWTEWKVVKTNPVK